MALYGELGTGKTTLVRGLARGLDIPPQLVGSPSFVLIREYRGRFPLAHADLFRLESEEDVQRLGLSEYFDGHTVVAIEWADKGASALPPDCLAVHLGHHSPSTRTVTLTATGPQSRRLLRELRNTQRLQRLGKRPKKPQATR